MLGLDAVEIDDFAVEHDADIAGLVDLVDEPPQQGVAAGVTHRGAHRAESKVGEPRADGQALAHRLARKIAGTDEAIDQPVGRRLRQRQRLDDACDFDGGRANAQRGR